MRVWGQPDFAVSQDTLRYPKRQKKSDEKSDGRKSNANDEIKWNQYVKLSNSAVLVPSLLRHRLWPDALKLSFQLHLILGTKYSAWEQNLTAWLTLPAVKVMKYRLLIESLSFLTSHVGFTFAFTSATREGHQEDSNRSSQEFCQENKKDHELKLAGVRAATELKKTRRASCKRNRKENERNHKNNYIYIYKLIEQYRTVESQVIDSTWGAGARDER